MGYIILSFALLSTTQSLPWFIALNEPNLLLLRIISFNAAAILATVFCMFLVFFYRTDGLLHSRLKKHLAGNSVFWPIDTSRKYISNIWQVDLGLLQIIALIGFLLSLVYRNDMYVIIWSILSILCYGFLHSKISNLELIMVDLYKNTKAVGESTRSKIIYADGEIILKEGVFIRRLSTYQLLSEYSDLVCYGFLPSNKLYFQFRNEEPFIINSRDAKTVIKLLNIQLEKNKIQSQIATSKTIQEFLDRIEKTNYLIASILVVLVLTGLALFFFWTGIQLGLPFLI